MESTVNDCGKFCATLEPICNAFHPELVSKTVWFAPGIVPRDHDGSCQFPLAGLVQLLFCAMPPIARQQIPSTITNRATPTTPREKKLFIPEKWKVPVKNPLRADMFPQKR